MRHIFYFIVTQWWKTNLQRWIDTINISRYPTLHELRCTLWWLLATYKTPTIHNSVPFIQHIVPKTRHFQCQFPYTNLRTRNMRPFTTAYAETNPLLFYATTSFSDGCRKQLYWWSETKNGSLWYAIENSVHNLPKFSFERRCRFHKYYCCSFYNHLFRRILKRPLSSVVRKCNIVVQYLTIPKMPWPDESTDHYSVVRNH